MSTLAAHPETHVTVTDPDDPHGSPAYDGEAQHAADRLPPGRYDAVATMLEPERPVHLIVRPDGTTAAYADVVEVTILVPIPSVGGRPDSCDVATVTGHVLEALEARPRRPAYFAERHAGKRVHLAGRSFDPEAAFDWWTLLPE